MSNTNSTNENQAIKLRKQGKSYNEIKSVLNIPKSTLSNWLKDLPLSKKIKNKNVAKTKLVWSKNITEFNKKRAIKYQTELKETIKKYSTEVSKINKKSLFWIGLSLFWAEGGKREKWMLRFTNSDPEMIKAMMRFYREICHVEENKIRLCIHLHPNISDKNAKKFWSELTNISINQFWKSQVNISKSSLGKRPKDRLPYGTLHVIILDSNLVKKIRGWNLGLIKQVNVPG